MNKTINRILMSGAILAMMTTGVGALPIAPVSSSSVLFGGETTQPAIDGILEAYFLSLDAGCDIEELYKQEAPDDGEPMPYDSGAYMDSYLTTFIDDPYDSGEATIVWGSGMPHIDPICSFLLVRDGNHNPAWYLFNLSVAGWDGMETLDLSGFWPSEGAISQVTLYGGTGSTPDGRGVRVPDGGLTIALLGLALCALGVANRGLCG